MRWAGLLRLIALRTVLSLVLSTVGTVASHGSEENLSVRAAHLSIRASIQSWLDAWVTRDVDAYLDHYSSRFSVPGGLSRDIWRTQRKDRLSRPGQIRVFITEPQIVLTGDGRARAIFQQEYRSNLVRLRTRKYLDFVFEGTGQDSKRWVIAGERVDELGDAVAAGSETRSPIPAALGEIEGNPGAVREVEMIRLKSVSHIMKADHSSEIRLHFSSDGFDVETSESKAAIVLRFDTPDAPPEVLPDPLLVAAGPLDSIELTRRANPMTLRLRLRDPETHFETIREPNGLLLTLRSGTQGPGGGVDGCFVGKPAEAKLRVKTEGGRRLFAMKSWHSFRDCEDCPEMVVVQGGRFTMGTPPGNEAKIRNESPGHTVEIGPFAAGKFEVTVGQFRAFTMATYRIPDEGCKMLDLADGHWARVMGLDWASPGFLQTDKHPVVCVSWDDARDYVDWLAKRTGKPYRLMTEAEWEYLASTGEPRTDESMLDPGNICRYANVADVGKMNGYSWKGGFPCEDRYWYTAATGAFRLNRHGIGDLFGNVWELLEDCWNGGYHGAPPDGRAWTCGSCQERVRRGGAWNSRPDIFRVERRSRQAISSRSATVGFRVARDLE